MCKQHDASHAWRDEITVARSSASATARTRIASLASKESGQGLVEYALLFLLVAVALVFALPLVGHQVSEVFDEVVAAMGQETAPTVLTVTNVQRASRKRARPLKIEYMLENNGGNTVYLLVEDSQYGTSTFYLHGNQSCQPVPCVLSLPAGRQAGQMSITPYNNVPSSGGEPTGNTVTFDYPEA